MSRNMLEIIADMNGAISGAITDLTLGIHGTLVDEPEQGGTPIDTGWASVNWWPAVGAAPTDNGGPVGEPSSRSFGQAAGVAEVTRYSIESRQPLWISNRVPYISRLNDGSSLQAPAGFVERAIEVNLSKFRGRRLT